MATSTSKTTTRKPATSKPATAAVKKPSAGTVAKPAINSKLVSVSDPDVTQADLKKRELIDMVVERSGIKKKDAKPVVEAMLAVLGETVASGRELNLQPLGKLRINRTIDKSNGRVFVCKLRQSDASKSKAKDPLAEAMDKL